MATAGGAAPVRGAAPSTLGATVARPSPNSAHPTRPKAALDPKTTNAPPVPATTALTCTKRTRPARATRRSPNSLPIIRASANPVKAAAASASEAGCSLRRSTALQLYAAPSRAKAQKANGAETPHGKAGAEEAVAAAGLKNETQGVGSSYRRCICTLWRTAPVMGTNRAGDTRGGGGEGRLEINVRAGQHGPPPGGPPHR